MEAIKKSFKIQTFKEELKMEVNFRPYENGHTRGFVSVRFEYKDKEGEMKFHSAYSDMVVKMSNAGELFISEPDEKVILQDENGQDKTVYNKHFVLPRYLKTKIVKAIEVMSPQETTDSL